MSWNIDISKPIDLGNVQIGYVYTYSLEYKGEGKIANILKANKETLKQKIKGDCGCLTGRFLEKTNTLILTIIPKNFTTKQELDNPSIQDYRATYKLDIWFEVQGEEVQYTINLEANAFKTLEDNLP